MTSSCPDQQTCFKIPILQQNADTPRGSTNEQATQILNEGSTLDLECMFDSIPPPTSVFLRDGMPLNDSDPRITVETMHTSTNNGISTLTIADIRGEERGAYSCTLTNVVGTSSVDITDIVVYGKYIRSFVDTRTTVRIVV